MAQDRDRLRLERDLIPLLTPTEAAALLRRAPATLANWRAAGTGPPHVKVGRLVRYRQSDLESWLRDEEHRRTRDPGPLLEPAKTPLTVTDMLEFLTAMKQRDGGDIPIYLEGPDTHGNVISVLLMGMRMGEGPDGHPAVVLFGPKAETAEQRRASLMQRLAAHDLSGTRIALTITPEEVQALRTAFELVDPTLAAEFVQYMTLQMQKALGAPVHGLPEQSAVKSVLTHMEFLHITSTAKLVTIGGMPCRVWKSTDAEGNASLVYIPFLRVPDVAADGEVEYTLEPVRAIHGRDVIPSGLPRYLQGTLYRSLDMQRLLTVLNTPAEPECAAARELVHELLAHGPTRRFFELFQASFALPGFSFASVQAREIDADPQHLQLWDAAEIPGGQAEGEEQWIPVAVATSDALWRWYVSKDPWRLKRCVECQQYFFDATRNGKKLHCTARCTTRRGTRTYRARWFL